MTASTRDMRDIVGGAILMAIGFGVAVYSFMSYDIGTLRRVGPGMFPGVLGLLLGALGIMVLVPALSKPGRDIAAPGWRPFLAIMASGAVFALTIARFGLVVAVIGATVIAAFANPQPRLGRVGVLAVTLAIASVLIFKLGLSMQVQIFDWRP
jgi:hypothetical protein